MLEFAPEFEGIFAHNVEIAVLAVSIFCVSLKARSPALRTKAKQSKEIIVRRKRPKVKSASAHSLSFAFAFYLWGAFVAECGEFYSENKSRGNFL
ncbi:MAG TPA: hypothetical protein VEQ40_12405 [Pyrinomonadaceae bacterium]|nr:hypothetical protein [Pyrinomonadaceae bacterium]